MRVESLYSKQVMKYFLHPKNMGRIKNPSGIGRAGNIICGDVMQLYIKVKKDRLVDVKYETFGCVAAISTSSIVSQLAKGKKIEQALRLTNLDIIKKLGRLPEQKIHCSILAVDALHEAIYDYLLKNKLLIPEKLQKEHERILETIHTIEERYR